MIYRVFHGEVFPWEQGRPSKYECSSEGAQVSNLMVIGEMFHKSSSTTRSNGDFILFCSKRIDAAASQHHLSKFKEARKLEG